MHLHRLTLAALSLVVGVGCSAARLVGPEPFTLEDQRLSKIVVLEPFFESTEWQLTTRTETAQVYRQFGTPSDVTISRQVAEKPLFARLESLVSEHIEVLREVQRLRPTWRVLSTSGVPAIEGQVSVVRTIVGEVEKVESNRTVKNLACAFGVILPPLLLLNLKPVHEVQRVNGAVMRYDAAADQLKNKLLRYPTQPDFAVDTRGLEATTRRFGLDLEYEEGVLAREDARDPVLLKGFAARLAVAVVAIVEEADAPLPQPPPGP